MSNDYADLLIQLAASEAADNVFQVTAQFDDGSVHNGLTAQLDEAALNRGAQDVVVYGRALRDFLFHGELANLWSIAKSRADATCEGRLRIRLRIEQNAAGLQRLAWEKLIPAGGDATIAWSNRASTPFSRYIPLALAEDAPVRERPLRVLVAMASPADLAPEFVQLDTDVEVNNVRGPLFALAQADQFKLTVMPGRKGVSAALRQELETEGVTIVDGPTTAAALTQAMSRHHLVFYVGHGAYDRGPDSVGNTYLFLETEEGLLELVADVDFARLLASQDQQPHFVFLSACETALRLKEDSHPFVGLGPRLIEAGLPAVVAMQALLPVETAHALVSMFIRQLSNHGLVDRALSEARAPLYRQDNDAWAIPVLFMRTRDGRVAVGDPAYEMLQRIRKQQLYARDAQMLPLPVDVVHIKGRENGTKLRLLSQEQSAAKKLLEAAREIFEERHVDKGRRRRCLAVLVGERGSTKSTQLKELANDAALIFQSERPVIPVIINLSNFAFATNAFGGPLQSLVYQSMLQIWPDLTPTQFGMMLANKNGLILRLFFDGSDDLTAEQRTTAWRSVFLMSSRYMHHEFLLASDPDHFSSHYLNTLRPTDMLVMQPLSQRQIKQFLEQSGSENDVALLHHLQRHHLFDLVETPWLMARIWTQAKEGNLPESRTLVLSDLVDEAFSRVQWLPGMRTRARISLQTLAWHMQNSLSDLITIDEAFGVLREVRGGRDYALELLFENLVNTELLARVGEDLVRFSSPPIRAYLCAREIAESAHWQAIVEDVTSTLGRLARLRWWESTLVYLAGILDDPRFLIENLVYGVNLLQSSQVFLAVRCIMEMTRGGNDARAWNDIDELAEQIVDSLIWRLNKGNEPNINRKIRAVESLGMMRTGNGIPYLTGLANLKTRRKPSGEMEYQASYVRMAAAVALHRQMPEVEAEIRTVGEANPADAEGADVLANVLVAWYARDKAILLDFLASDDDSAQVLASFALAEWQPAGAFDALAQKFFQQKRESQLMWGLSESLALFETQLVLDKVILPLLDDEKASEIDVKEDVWQKRARWYRVMAYLIGKTRATNERAVGFLYDCLNKGKDLYLKGKAIEALGWLYNDRYLSQFEGVATGEFKLLKHASRARKAEKTYLQKKALLSLAFIGDQGSLTKLRQNRHQLLSELPELEEIFFQTTEEIYWRFSAQRQQEMVRHRQTIQ